MYHLGEGTRSSPIATRVNGHGRVTESVSLSLYLDLFGALTLNMIFDVNDLETFPKAPE